MKDIEELRVKKELLNSSLYQQIRTMELNMIVEFARTYEPLEIVGMLKLIGKVDEWEKDFNKELEKRRK